MTAVTTDFLDDQLLSEKSVILQVMTDKEIVTLGREYLPMLSSGFSPKGVGAIFQMAFNLRDPKKKNTNVLPYGTNILTKNDIPLQELSEEVWGSKISVAITPLSQLNNESEEEKAYAFIAASTLRLFSKPETNYIRGFNQICAGYRNFYGNQFPVSLMNPTLEALKTLNFNFSNNPIFKSTLYKILHLGGETKNAIGLRRFLYEIHLIHSGLHIISIFDRLCGALNCDPGLPLSKIKTREFSCQVDGLTRVRKLMENRDDEHKRGMWKYGRIFDEAFMDTLRTKNCLTLVYVLASALKSLDPENNRDILNIIQLEDVNPEKIRRCDLAGLTIVKVILTGKLEGKEG